MLTLEALVFGMDDLDHVLLPMAMTTLAIKALVLDMTTLIFFDTGVVDIGLASCWPWI